MSHTKTVLAAALYHLELLYLQKLPTELLRESKMHLCRQAWRRARMVERAVVGASS